MPKGKNAYVRMEEIEDERSAAAKIAWEEEQKRLARFKSDQMYKNLESYNLNAGPKINQVSFEGASGGEPSSSTKSIDNIRLGKEPMTVIIGNAEDKGGSLFMRFASEDQRSGFILQYKEYIIKLIDSKQLLLEGKEGLIIARLKDYKKFYEKVFSRFEFSEEEIFEEPKKDTDRGYIDRVLEGLESCKDKQIVKDMQPTRKTNAFGVMV